MTPLAMAQRIELWPIEKLIPYTRNPRTHSEAQITAPPAVPVTRTGDLWEIGRHRLICGDGRDPAVVASLFGGAFANCAITSPPYATKREYDPASGFQPVPPAEYVEWYGAIA